MVHEKPTPSFGSYESAPTPVKDTNESSPVEDSYEEKDTEEDKEDSEESNDPLGDLLGGLGLKN